jgi:hypothetical protein
MLRILFDKNIPYSLRRHLTVYEVKTAEEEGWGQIANGSLIRCAEEAGYQVFLTCDQNVRYQQNLTRRTISMVVLGWNIWPGIQPKLGEIMQALQRVVPGSFEFIEIAPLPKRRRLRELREEEKQQS